MSNIAFLVLDYSAIQLSGKSNLVRWSLNARSLGLISGKLLNFHLLSFNPVSPNVSEILTL
jgi:hypothetical protein